MVIQPAERFGQGLDPDGDGVVNKLTRGEVASMGDIRCDDAGARPKQWPRADMLP